MFNNIRKPYIIAEIGVNHNGNLELAKKMIDLAKEGGANAVKFQTYKADKLASKNSPAYWDINKENTKSQYELFKKYDVFGKDEYIKLATYCNTKDIDFLSTPFDLESVDFLDPIMKYYKIASADITNIPLLKKIASKNKPVILSIGASYIYEIHHAVHILKSSGIDEINIMHCILNYPTDAEDANLYMIKVLKKYFPDLRIGYSDHTIPDDKMRILTIAWLYGAEIIEKHFTYDKKLPGNDHYHAMDVNDLKVFVDNINYIINVSGNMNEDELVKMQMQARINARRSIFTNKKINKGEIYTYSNLICKRPGTGISPVELDNIIGKRAANELQEDQLLKWIDVE
jgi:N-acetylneuraminate synthase